MDAVTADTPTILLINPESRRGQKLFEEYRLRFDRALNLVDAAMTESKEDMIRRIEEGLALGVSRFIIGGGDGTLSQAADILVGSDAVLGVLPLGTGNTFFHGLDLPTAPEELVSVLTDGPVARYDVGLAVKENRKTVFLNSLTMGFSQRLVELLTRESKFRLGHLAWIVEFRRALANTPTMDVTISWPGGRDHFETRQLVVVNGRTLAAGIQATPASSGQDGLLEVFRLGGPSFASIARLGTKLLAGRLLTDREAHYRMLTELTVDAQPALPVNIDGDLWLKPPVHCRVLAGALAVISPSPQGQSPRRWPLVSRPLGTPHLVFPPLRTYSMRETDHKS